MTTEKIQLLPWTELQPNPYNRGGGNGTRSGFDPKSLKELADSIAARTEKGVAGIIQPIIAREIPSPAGAGEGGRRSGEGRGAARYEIIAGERRWTAAGQVSEKLKIPVIVRDYDDSQAREVNAIENLQRVGLHFLEEAQGFQDLLDLKLPEPYTVQKIAKAIGKNGKDGSAAYVYARLKLLKLPELAREACFLGKMNHSLALLVARIPDPKLAHKATLEILAPVHRTAEAALDKEVEPMSYRQAKTHVQDHYMIRLKDAPFDRENADLVPIEFSVSDGKTEVFVTHDQDTIRIPLGRISRAACEVGGSPWNVWAGTESGTKIAGPMNKPTAEALAKLINSGAPGEPLTVTRVFGGPCSTCPFRTGNLKHLFPDVDSEDVCTQPGCFKKKKDADLKRAQALAREEGVVLLKPSESNRLFQDGRLLETGTGYVDLADNVPGKTRKTWKDFLEAEQPQGVWQAAVIQARDDLTPPVTHLLLPVAVATEAAEAAGMKPKALETLVGRESSRAESESPEDREAAEAERQQRVATAQTAEAEALAQVRAKVTRLKADKKFWQFLAAQLLDGNFYTRHKLHTDKEITRFLKKRTDAELRAYVVEAVCFSHNVGYQGDFTENFKAHCKHFKVDWKKILKQAGARATESV